MIKKFILFLLQISLIKSFNIKKTVSSILISSLLNNNVVNNLFVHIDIHIKTHTHIFMHLKQDILWSLYVIFLDDFSYFL